MRSITYFSIVISLCSLESNAQRLSDNSRFTHVDSHVAEVKKQFIFHPELLAIKLSENLTNDYDKVRAFYVWIANNVEYDLYSYLQDSYGGQSVNEVLRSGKALCTGYSLLLKFFCDQINIESIIIDGYAKGYGYKKGQKFKKPNHAWNAVKIYDRWYLLDVTWASGSAIHLSRHQRQLDLNSYFLTDPQKLIQTHLPEDPSWQLLQNKISLSDFEEDEYRHVSDYSFNGFSPDDYENKSEYDKDILRYTRALEFNPNNDSFHALLSFAYLYKGISLTDNLWKLSYHQLKDTVTVLKKVFNAYMDSSWMVIKDIENDNIPYTKKIMEEEINYQKGVINYELAAELFVKARKSNISFTHFTQKTDNYFNTAEHHFKQVPPSSIYHKDAQEYLVYIQDFRSRKNNR